MGCLRYNRRVDLVTLVQQLINGLSLGSLYALVAIGYTMVYGILRLINFAHGDLLMVAAYVAVMGVGLFSLPWPAAFGLAIAVTGLIGVLLERGAYRPLRRAPRISLLISAIAASFLLENLALVIAGGRPKAFPVPPLFNGVFSLGGVFIPRLSLLIPAITALLLGGLFYLVYRTRTGRAMRAIAQDLETTSLMGIDINRTIAATFFIGAFLAGAGGVMYGLSYNTTVFDLGFSQGLAAFTAAVFGGIGNIYGAAVGGLLLGLIRTYWDGYFDSAWSDVMIFAILILVLVFRPTGIFGMRVPEK